MDDLVVVATVKTEAEAEVLSALLRSADIQSMHRSTNVGAGVFEGLPGGPREILVRLEDLEGARAALREQTPGEY